MKVTVYLGSSLGNKAIYEEQVVRFGTFLGENNHTLIYGGSHCGTMDALANATLRAKGHVKGIMPQFFVDQDRHKKDLSELQIVTTMQERIALLIGEGDVFVAFPGGIGTLEEAFSTISSIVLGNKQANFYFVNTDGFFNDVKKQLENMKKAGFVSSDLSNIYFVDDVNELIMYLQSQS